MSDKELIPEIKLALITIEDQLKGAISLAKKFEAERDKANKRIEELEKEAKRFYNADGTYTEHDGDVDVIGLRIEAAKIIQDLTQKNGRLEFGLKKIASSKLVSSQKDIKDCVVPSEQVVAIYEWVIKVAKEALAEEGGV